ncbi:hypothetical protein SDC9_30501 [bioreactor metagenome]|uniref:Rubredoxin-like domain-containing protein n=1 Tax=bioreactor metagenome TaxID=1076179 RepID=A0A644UZN7_9ZZZZ|nr:hypothetical protein [Methanobrevibacter sp.]MEA4957567.1 hypothetical protein [Methanobrevibacter sp.]
MIFSTKKVAEPGTYKCNSCGTIQEHNKKDEKLYPCPKCKSVKWEKMV